MIYYLFKRYGKESPLIVKKERGIVIGMVLNYSIDGKIQISMDDYIDVILKTITVIMSGESTTPPGNHLFTVNPDAIPLSESESDE